MTAKRFTITQDFEEHHRQIRDNGHIIMGCFLEVQAEPIVKLLNEQHETIQRLKQNITELLSVDIEEELLKENEQLKHDLALYEENNTNEVLNQLRIELTSRLNDCIEEFKE